MLRRHRRFLTCTDVAVSYTPHRGNGAGEAKRGVRPDRERERDEAVSVLERPVNVAVPSELSPEDGQVTICGAMLLEGQRWVADGAHFIESTEVDVRGQGDDLSEAVGDFVNHAISLSHVLATHVREGTATDHEVQTHALLAERLAGVMAAIEESETRRRDAVAQLLRLRRRRFREANTWRRAPLNRSRPLSRV
jgi:hypothetical protein